MYPPRKAPMGFLVPRMDEDAEAGGDAMMGGLTCFGAVTVVFRRMVK